MRQVLFSGLIAAAFLVGQSTGPSSITAQPPRAGAKAASGGVIEIKQGRDHKFRFSVRGGDGKLLAMSGPTGFATVKDAQAAIVQLKDVVSKAKVNVVESGGKSGK